MCACLYIQVASLCSAKDKHKKVRACKQAHALFDIPLVSKVSDYRRFFIVLFLIYANSARPLRTPTPLPLRGKSFSFRFGR